jgi:hypothetical protein
MVWRRRLPGPSARIPPPCGSVRNTESTKSSDYLGTPVAGRRKAIVELLVEASSLENRWLGSLGQRRPDQTDFAVARRRSRAPHVTSGV